MQYQKEHLHFIANIYDLALEDKNWTEVLDRFSHYMNCKGASIHAFDPRHSLFKLNALSSSYDLDKVAYFEKHLAHYDQPAFEYTVSKSDTLFYPDIEAFGFDSLEQYQQHPPIKWLRETLGVKHRSAARLNLQGAWYDFIAMQFTHDYQPLSQTQIELGQLFVPHLAKAVELNRTFMLLKSYYHSAITSLDKLGIGVFITDGLGDVVLKNTEALRIIEAGDGFYQDINGRIRCRIESDNIALHKALKANAKTAQGLANNQPELFSVSRKSNATDYLVSVSALTDSSQNITDSFKGVITFIIDPDNKVNLSTKGMQQLYQLSSAESDVCRLLIEGLSTQDIADSRSVNIETIRSQLKTIFRKTNSKKQSDLVRLAVTCNPPIKHE